MREIQLRDAKASLSAVVDDAVRGKPAVITRHGKKEAVVLSFKEWERLSQVPSFGRLLMAAPIAPDDLPERDRTPLRDAGLSAGVSRRYQCHLGWGTVAARAGWAGWLDGYALGIAVSLGRDGGGDRGRHRQAAP